MGIPEDFPLWDFGNRIVRKLMRRLFFFFFTFSPQEGEVDCWPLTCPSLSCEYTTILEGECCPRCVSDPCLADNIAYDIRKTCLDSYGLSRLSGSVWTMAGSPCTTCKCKVIGCPEGNQASDTCLRTPAGGPLLIVLNARVPRGVETQTGICFSPEVNLSDWMIVVLCIKANSK